MFYQAIPTQDVTNPVILLVYGMFLSSFILCHAFPFFTIGATGQLKGYL
jgi:hypothetical protein